MRLSNRWFLQKLKYYSLFDKLIGFRRHSQRWLSNIPAMYDARRWFSSRTRFINFPALKFIPLIMVFFDHRDPPLLHRGWFRHSAELFLGRIIFLPHTLHFNWSVLYSLYLLETSAVFIAHFIMAHRAHSISSGIKTIPSSVFLCSRRDRNTTFPWKKAREYIIRVLSK